MNDSTNFRTNSAYFLFLSVGPQFANAGVVHHLRTFSDTLEVERTLINRPLALISSRSIIYLAVTQNDF